MGDAPVGSSRRQPGGGHHVRSWQAHRERLVGYLELQLTAIRAAAYGLTEQQARETPCRSALSIGGLIKHVTYLLQARAAGAADPGAVPDEAGYALFMASFASADGETLAGALAAFAELSAAYLADVRTADPGADMIGPPAPWDGTYGPTDSVQRYELVHHIEELARHAGHADIIREQLDGAAADGGRRAQGQRLRPAVDAPGAVTA